MSVHRNVAKLTDREAEALKNPDTEFEEVIMEGPDGEEIKFTPNYIDEDTEYEGSFEVKKGIPDKAGGRPEQAEGRPEQAGGNS